LITSVQGDAPRLAPARNDFGRRAVHTGVVEQPDSGEERAHDGGAIVAELIRRPTLVNEAAKFDQTTRASAARLHPGSCVEAGVGAFSADKRCCGSV
jgi:hypothetical protein